MNLADNKSNDFFRKVLNPKIDAENVIGQIIHDFEIKKAFHEFIEEQKIEQK